MKNESNFPNHETLIQNLPQNLAHSFIAYTKKEFLKDKVGQNGL